MTSFISDQDDDQSPRDKAIFGGIALAVMVIWTALAMWHSAVNNGQAATTPPALECTRLDSYKLADETVSLWDCGENKRAYLRERDADNYTSLRLILPLKENVDAPQTPVPRD